MENTRAKEGLENNTQGTQIFKKSKFTAKKEKPTSRKCADIKLGTNKRKHTFNCPECGIDGLTKYDLSKHYNIYHSAEATKKRAN